MTPAAWAVFEPFRGLEHPNTSNVVRHRMIDDLLRARLARRPDTGVVILGAGFDTRAFRLPGGQWVELDEPPLIELKEARLPAKDAPNPLTRVPIAFEHDTLDSALAPYRSLPEPIVVLEGVLAYLTVAELRRLLEAIRRTFGSPTLICDLTTRAFVRRFAGEIGERLRTLGAPYGRLEGEPLELIEAAGFTLEARESVVGWGAARGLLPIPRWLLATLFRSLRDGYTIATFAIGGERPAGATAPPA
jgi:O-methyltransferase involved in polyketide biosynthesis